MQKIFLTLKKIPTFRYAANLPKYVHFDLFTNSACLQATVEESGAAEAVAAA
jgi:hypothetical protein